MQSIRMAALALVLAGVSISGKFAFAQQEIDPDHFDQKPQATQAKPVHHQKQASSAAAAKRSVAAKHHRSHPAA